MASELATILGPLRRDSFNCGHCISLVKVVIQKASDSEALSAVLDLITTRTPPASISANVRQHAHHPFLRVPAGW
jgi:hypothetical protein